MRNCIFNRVLKFYNVIDKKVVINLMKDEYGIELIDHKLLIGKKLKSVFPDLKFTPLQYRIFYQAYHSALARLKKDEYKSKGGKTADLNKVKNYKDKIFIYEYFGKFILNGTGVVIKVLDKIPLK